MNAGTDHRYRITIAKDESAAVVVDHIRDIAHENFKASGEDSDLHDLCWTSRTGTWPTSAASGGTFAADLARGSASDLS